MVDKYRNEFSGYFEQQQKERINDYLKSERQKALDNGEEIDELTAASRLLSKVLGRELRVSEID